MGITTHHRVLALLGFSVTLDVTSSFVMFLVIVFFSCLAALFGRLLAFGQCFELNFPNEFSGSLRDGKLGRESCHSCGFLLLPELVVAFQMLEEIRHFCESCGNTTKEKICIRFVLY